MSRYPRQYITLGYISCITALDQIPDMTHNDGHSDFPHMAERSTLAAPDPPKLARCQCVAWWSVKMILSDRLSVRVTDYVSSSQEY